MIVTAVEGEPVDRSFERRYRRALRDDERLFGKPVCVANTSQHRCLEEAAKARREGRYEDAWDFLRASRMSRITGITHLASKERILVRQRRENVSPYLLRERRSLAEVMRVAAE